jgi:hypothetical protein
MKISSLPDAVLVRVFSISNRSPPRIAESAMTIIPTTQRLRTTVKNRKRNGILKFNHFQTALSKWSQPLCPSAASRHRGPSRNWTPALWSATTTAGNGAHPVKTAAEFGQWPNASNGRAKRKRTQKRGLMITLTVLDNRGARHVPTNFRETFRYFGSCPSFGRDARFSCERADQL